jgi:hypothetical protein
LDQPQCRLGWVGYGINEIPHEILPRGRKLVILATEGHDSGIVTHSRSAAYAVTLQAAAIDDEIGFMNFSMSLNAPEGEPLETYDLRGEADRSASRPNLAHHRLSHSVIVDYTLRRHMKCRKPRGMRLELANLRWSEQAQAFKAIRCTALLECVEPLKLLFVRSDDKLAAYLMRDIVLAAEVHHSADSFDREARLHRTRRIVQPAMKDSAVMSSLVAAWATLFFE